LSERKGSYIAFDGIDGCGKDTLADMLTSYWGHQGKDPLRVNEPTDGHNPIGGLIRTLLADGACGHSHAALFLADRLELQRQTLPEALHKGRPVVSSRCFLSTLAFQQDTWPLDWLLSMHQEMMFPDVILVLDVTPEEGVARRKGRDRVEYYEQEERQTIYRRRFLELAKDSRIPCLVEAVDGMGTPTEVFGRVKAALGIKHG
jgi:dTMP kinase